ncbi:MUC1-extracellular alpha-1 4-glucan glucosidase [Fusarium pseudoanthophilum]|uniref:MUC1-extracellular alpha-1 4-glucan glucosidase n=1 Tax=Fusarium pseudoanthophilum TaxID=48495 RepID=A0A8H5UX98_9HYPO|nr:MUC1-extracellular alpha-1 4-glucan glucosidase [Fusarium pseudoanthophilum]
MKLQLGLFALWASTAMAATCQQFVTEGPYTANNVDYAITCGKEISGTSYRTQEAQNAGLIEQCMAACSDDSSCIAIQWDSIGICDLFSSITGTTGSYTDIAVRVQPTTSTSMQPSTTSADASATSSTGPQCQPSTVPGPYSAQNMEFEISCGQALTGASYNNMDSSYAGSIEECILACADDAPTCTAITWSLLNGCLLYSSVSATSSGAGDIAVLQQQSPSTTSTSMESSTSSSASATSSTAPLCQAGTYTSSTNNVQFNTACGRHYVGTEISYSPAADLQGCMDMCASDSNCVAVSLSYSGNVNICYLFAYTSYSTPDGSSDLAVVSSRPSATSSAERRNLNNFNVNIFNIVSRFDLNIVSRFNLNIVSRFNLRGTLNDIFSTSSLPERYIVYVYVFHLNIHIFVSYSIYVYTLYVHVFVSYVICIYVFHRYTFYNYLTYNYNIHPIFNPIYLYNFADIIRAHLLTVHVTVHESTLTPTTSTSAGSSLLSSLLTTTTTSSTETSTIATSASTENPTSETSISEITISSSSAAPEASSSSSSQTTTETESTALSTQPQTSPITSAPPSGSSTSPSSTTSTTSSTPSISPSNIQVLDGYDFIACLRSDEGFPTFTEVATQADMTTEICVKLAVGSIYVGVYQQADSLAGSEIVEDARCSLPCPGDSGLLLFLLLFIFVFVFHLFLHPFKSLTGFRNKGVLINIRIDCSDKSHAIISTTVSELRSIPSTPSQNTPGPIRTIRITKGVTYTEIVVATTVTTVTYVTINPSQPGALITTCIPLTLQYTPCGCDHQEYPPVDMTTIISPCHACGSQGQDVVTMVVPVAACEGGGVNYNPSGWIAGEAGNNGYPDQIQGHQIYTGSEGDASSQPHPTQGQQNGEGLGYGNGPSGIEAATQASGGGAQNKQPANLQPTQGQKSGKGPDYQNGPSGTKAAAQGPAGEAQNKETASPVPAQGQQNTDRPGSENEGSSVAVQTWPGDNNKNQPGVPASQSSNAQKPPKPSPLPEGQQASSGGLTRETGVVPAPQPDTPTRPSHSVPINGHNPDMSTTFATEVEVTKEAGASESTHSLSSLGHGEASSVPSTVSSSEAYGHQISYWGVIVVIVGLVLLL